MTKQAEIKTLSNHREYQEHALKRLLSIDPKMTQEEYDGRIAALANKFEHDVSVLSQSGEGKSS